MSLGPKWLQVLAHFSPVYYVVEAPRTLAAGTIAAKSALVAFAVIVPLLTIALTWATIVYKKAMA